MKLRIVRLLMWQFNQRLSYGVESQAWQDFVEDCRERYGCHPWDEGSGEREVSVGFAERWIDVSKG